MAKAKRRESEAAAAEGAEAGAAGAPESPSKPPEAAPESPAAVSRDAAPEQASWLAWFGTYLPTDRHASRFVFVLGFLLFIPFLGTLGLWDPWETHYGEVARAMIQRNDYVHPYWESAYFFSKPALSLWLMALGFVIFRAEAGPPGAPLGEWTEWGARLPFAFIAVLTLWAVYRIGKQLRDRNTGVLAALVLGSSPQFIFIGKQAMTDMPLVGLMTIGMAFFMAAMFDEEPDGAPALPLKIGTVLFLNLCVLPQLALIGMKYSKPLDLMVLGGTAAVTLGLSAYLFLKASRRDLWLVCFYALTGLAALAKGLAVLAVVGPVVLLYACIALDFNLIVRSKFYSLGAIFLLVGAPWYVVMTRFKGRDDEGLTFTQRFWTHDNFSRIGAGVHGDRAGLGYYLEQLGYGMFPWAALIPFSIGHGAAAFHGEAAEQKRRATLFVLIWALWCYAFFTMSQTKFHHYIFPAVPALAVLVALWFHHLLEDPARRLRRSAAIVVLVLLAVIVRDLMNTPQHLVSLFTYKYDREYPRNVEPRVWMGVIIGVFSLAMIALYATKRAGFAALAFLLMACTFGAWISHHHFNMLSPHWSQYHLFDTYQAEKKGEEPIYAYQLNWRGETFYSRNTVLQVKEGNANQRIKSLTDQPGREFIITEQSRFHTLRSALSADKRDKLQILDRSSTHFYLCVVED